LSKQKRLLIISQVYPPDPTAVGQYFNDVAKEMVERGWQVIVFTADRGYDNPSIKYLKKEVIGGVEVKRFPCSSFGKISIKRRLAAAVIFLFQSLIYGLLTPGLNSILISTSPPMCYFSALVIASIKRVPIYYWIMDLNPDQAVMLGLSKKSVWVNIFNIFNRLFLQSADHIIALDQYMANRLNKKLEVDYKMSVIPPWPLVEYSEEISHEQNPFRIKHGLESKFVFMYSGNYTFTNPVTTILRAALLLKDRYDIIFMFVGGGRNKHEVDDVIKRHNPKNIISLPYQSFADMKYSLAAADTHIVSIGQKLSGIVHPSKIYGAMAAGRPVLFLGPADSFIGRLVIDNNIGWQINHGNIEEALNTITSIIETPLQKLKEMGSRARKLAANEYSRSLLLNQFCAIIDK